MTLLGLVSGVVVGALAVPTSVLALECAVGAWPTGPSRRARGIRPRVAVLVPAHDEATAIGPTVESLAREIGTGDRILVVADNCTDETAARARAAGAEVIERVDPERRGKGYALSFGLDHLATDPPDVVVVFDADCAPAPGAIGRVAEAAATFGRPAQADYVLEAPEASSAKTRVSAFAVIVRNRVRLRGLWRIAGTCPLVGSGMAFPWEVLAGAAAMGGELVEDLALGVDCALRGYPPVFVADACVTSSLPMSAEAALGQRRRWESGHLRLSRRAWARLVVAGARRRDPRLVALGLDLAVPPLSLLTLGLVGAGAASVAAGGALPAILVAAQVAACGAALGSAWWLEGRTVLPPRAALGVAAYVVWKIPIYTRFVTRGGERTWVRTERAA